MDANFFLDLFKDCNLIKPSYETAEKEIIKHLPEDFEFEWKRGASKLVLIPYYFPFVIKIPLVINCMGEENTCANSTNRFYDYCFTEMMLYRQAKKKKVEKILAKEKIIAEKDGVNIYIQEKAELYHPPILGEITSKSGSAQDIIYKKDMILSQYEFYPWSWSQQEENEQWLIDVLEYYGEKQFNKIISFFKEEMIDDLHYENIGYIGDRPVAFDYSGFAG